MTGQYTGKQVNEILDATRAMTNDGDAQLSILARAFIVGCQSTGCSEQRASAILANMWKVPMRLVPIRELKN